MVVKTCFIDLSSNDNGINLNHSFIRDSVAIYGGRVLVRHSGALVKQKTPPRIKWTTVWTHLSPFKSKLCSVSSYFRCDAVLSIIVAKWETEKKKCIIFQRHIFHVLLYFKIHLGCYRKKITSAFAVLSAFWKNYITSYQISDSLECGRKRTARRRVRWGCNYRETPPKSDTNVFNLNVNKGVSPPTECLPLVKVWIYSKLVFSVSSGNLSLLVVLITDGETCMRLIGGLGLMSSSQNAVEMLSVLSRQEPSTCSFLRNCNLFK